MKVVTHKYGGSSVATTEKIKNVASKISERVKEGYKFNCCCFRNGENNRRFN